MELLRDPHLFTLALVLLGAAGLGAGLSLGKGGVLLAKLKGNGNGKVNVSVAPPVPSPVHAGHNCLECIRTLAQMFPCKDHSGLVADMKNNLAATQRIESNVEKVWDAIGGLSGDVKELIKTQNERRA